MEYGADGSEMRHVAGQEIEGIRVQAIASKLEVDGSIRNAAGIQEGKSRFLQVKYGWLGAIGGSTSNPYPNEFAEVAGARCQYQFHRCGRLRLTC
jgi:hypothetical protein